MTRARRPLVEWALAYADFGLAVLPMHNAANDHRSCGIGQISAPADVDGAGGTAQLASAPRGACGVAR
jgi:hypothetical protein